MELKIQLDMVMKDFKYHDGGQNTSPSLDLIFDIPYDYDTEISLIPFRKKMCKCFIVPKTENKFSKGKVIKGTFEVLKPEWYDTRKIERYRLVITGNYTKELEVIAASFRKDECTIALEAIEDELNFEKMEGEKE